MKAYFSHDEGARNDPKLVKVLMRLGQAGKGVYWDLVEMLYEQGGYLLMEECESYAFALRTEPQLLLKLVSDFDLFATDGTKFWSETCLERMKMRNAKAEARAQAGAKGGKAKAEREAAAKALLEQEHSNATENSSIATALPPKKLAIKEKEIKEKEGKPSPSLRSGGEPEHFAAFWQAYPRKEARVTALKAFQKLSPQEQAAAPQAARDWFGRRPAADWFKADGTDVRPHPTTWLNQKRWTDLTEVNIIPTQETQQSHGNPQRNAVQRNGLTFANDDKRRASLDVIAGIKW